MQHEILGQLIICLTLGITLDKQTDQIPKEKCDCEHQNIYMFLTGIDQKSQSWFKIPSKVRLDPKVSKNQRKNMLSTGKKVLRISRIRQGDNVF